MTTRFAAAVAAIAILAASAADAAEHCVASYFTEGRHTASGERYDRWAPTCAHRRHAFGTMLRVTRLDTGATTTCRVNDRGPFIRGRCVDMSAAGGRSLGLNRSGVARVIVEVLPQG